MGQQREQTAVQKEEFVLIPRMKTKVGEKLGGEKRKGECQSLVGGGTVMLLNSWWEWIAFCVFLVFGFCLFVLSMPRSMRNLSSPTRD